MGLPGHQPTVPGTGASAVSGAGQHSGQQLTFSVIKQCVVELKIARWLGI